MIKIVRDLENPIREKFQPGKVIVLNGARRVGKTFLLKQIMEKLSDPYLMLNGEDLSTHEALERQTFVNYRDLLGDRRILIIDEAQQVPGIGDKLKLMIDEIDGLRVLVSGSSAFAMDTGSGDALTGRRYTFTLAPFSVSELDQITGITGRTDSLRKRLVYGSYPELFGIQNVEDQQDYLKELIGNYLMKDLMAYEQVRNSSKIAGLLRLLAFQVGSQVSLNELGNQLSMSKNTVERYLDILSKLFIIHKVEGFSRNLRKEVTKSARWFFIDNGIRNAVIANFNPIELRQDTGALWENFIILERLKKQGRLRMAVNNYFWRTYDQQEIDWVEEREGNLFAYEIKWSKVRIKPPKAWSDAYPDSTFQTVTKENYRDWII
ncbi:MAG: ATP-binding protein [Porphyromonadaceae bacterium]|nr:MAG: ATP-binding protein [Porphyromonadaceae bacterium]